MVHGPKDTVMSSIKAMGDRDDAALEITWRQCACEGSSWRSLRSPDEFPEMMDLTT